MSNVFISPIRKQSFVVLHLYNNSTKLCIIQRKLDTEQSIYVDSNQNKMPNKLKHIFRYSLLNMSTKFRLYKDTIRSSCHVVETSKDGECEGQHGDYKA